jgi:putative transposase
MQIQADQLYHIYNQGNNKETIFKERADYLSFLNCFRDKVAPHCQVVNYCLMPNHFHFLINATQASAIPVMLGSVKSTALANGFRMLSGAHAHAFNKKYDRSGSLFRQKTKAKLLETADADYPFTCFHYIHQNPVRAGLCEKMEDWEFSSFQDYCGLRNGSLANKDLAYTLVGVSMKGFYEESYQMIDDDKIKKLFVE